MSNKFFIGVILAIVVVGGFFVVNKKDSGNSNNGNDNSSNVTGTPSEHKKGAGNKKVTLVEYGDFECPGCGAYYPLIKQVTAAYGDDITFQFRNFPLTQIHQYAMAAHRAAESAQQQGKFWEMFDLIYENQTAWKSSPNPSVIFEQYAQQLGLNMDKFRSDLSSDAVFGTINADIKEGQKLGFSGTPSFVIDGEEFSTKDELARIDTFDELKKIIDDKIAQHQ